MRRHSAQAEVCVQVFYVFGCFLTEHDLSIIYIFFLVIFVALLHFYLLLFVCEARSQLQSAARDILKQLCYVVFFVNLCYCHWAFVIAFCSSTEVSCCQFPHSS